MSGSSDPVAARSVKVEEARMESAEEICRGFETIAFMFDTCVRPSGSAMVFSVDGDMVEHTEDGWA